MDQVSGISRRRVGRRRAGPRRPEGWASPRALAPVLVTRPVPRCRRGGARRVTSRGTAARATGSGLAVDPDRGDVADLAEVEGPAPAGAGSGRTGGGRRRCRRRPGPGRSTSRAGGRGSARRRGRRERPSRRPAGPGRGRCRPGASRGSAGGRRRPPRCVCPGRSASITAARGAGRSSARDRRGRRDRVRHRSAGRARRPPGSLPSAPGERDRGRVPVRPPDAGTVVVPVSGSHSCGTPVAGNVAVTDTCSARSLVTRKACCRSRRSRSTRTSAAGGDSCAAA